MKTKIFKFLILMLSSIIIASTSLFPVSAAQNSSNTYKLSISRPSTGSSTGYAEVLIEDSSGNNYVRVFSWCISQVAISNDTLVGYITSVPLLLNVSSSGITFKFPAMIGVEGTFFADIHTINNGQNYYYQRINNSDEWTFSGKIKSLHAYGNYALNGSDTLSNAEFYVLYSDNGPIYNAIVNGQQDQTDLIIQGQEAQTSSITSNQNKNTSSIISNYNSNTDKLTSNQNKNTSSIIANQNANVSKIIGAGSDVAQPDFAGTNSSLDGTVHSIENIEGNYQLDQTATTSTLNEGTNFLSGTQMQRASLQVKSWIERFTSENQVITGFLISALCLGLCFWVIGRKSF